VLPLVRLGLRAGEVAALHLEDIDWRARELGVYGKGDGHERLSQLDDVGMAVTGYPQRGRPTTAFDELHNGSVWPHDSAIVVAGLMRYGFVEHAQRVAMALVDAAERSGGRLPGLFCGFPTPSSQHRSPIRRRVPTRPGPPPHHCC
jgi:hypothetical protein